MLLDTQDRLSQLTLVQTLTSADNVLSQKAGDKTYTPRTAKVSPPFIQPMKINRSA